MARVRVWVMFSVKPRVRIRLSLELGFVCEVRISVRFSFRIMVRCG